MAVIIHCKKQLGFYNNNLFCLILRNGETVLMMADRVKKSTLVSYFAIILYINKALPSCIKNILNLFHLLSKL